MSAPRSALPLLKDKDSDRGTWKNRSTVEIRHTAPPMPPQTPSIRQKARLVPSTRLAVVALALSPPIRNAAPSFPVPHPPPPIFPLFSCAVGGLCAHILVRIPAHRMLGFPHCTLMSYVPGRRKRRCACEEQRRREGQLAESSCIGRASLEQTHDAHTHQTRLDLLGNWGILLSLLVRE